MIQGVAATGGIQAGAGPLQQSELARGPTGPEFKMDNPATAGTGKVDAPRSGGAPETIALRPEVFLAQDPTQKLEAVKNHLHQVLDKYDAKRLEPTLQMFRVMTEVQEASLHVELFSKCVEQSVSGVKTVLQTQT